MKTYTIPHEQVVELLEKYPYPGVKEQTKTSRTIPCSFRKTSIAKDKKDNTNKDTNTNN